MFPFNFVPVTSSFKKKAAANQGHVARFVGLVLELTAVHNTC